MIKNFWFARSNSKRWETTFLFMSAFVNGWSSVPSAPPLPKWAASLNLVYWDLLFVCPVMMIKYDKFASNFLAIVEYVYA